MWTLGTAPTRAAGKRRTKTPLQMPNKVPTSSHGERAGIGHPEALDDCFSFKDSRFWLGGIPCLSNNTISLLHGTQATMKREIKIQQEKKNLSNANSGEIFVSRLLQMLQLFFHIALCLGSTLPQLEGSTSAT